MSTGLILGIETSCDETAAAVVRRGARTLSSVVASQIPTHAPYGGVVPELASREHLRAIVPVVRAALAQANVALADLDAIAVTSGPGLAGALLVGITYAKALAYAQNIPLIAVNHLEGHIHAVLLNERETAAKAQNPERIEEDEAVLSGHDPSAVSGQALSRAENAAKSPGALEAAKNLDIRFEIPERHPAGAEARIDFVALTARLKSCPDTSPSLGSVFPAACFALEGNPVEPAPALVVPVEPALALVVSGGHTHLYLARPANGTWTYKLMGRTVDDAAGEAFDKVAKLLGLGYPGGPWIDALARYGDPQAVPFSFAQVKPKAHLAGKTPRTKAAETAPIAALDPHFLFSFSGIKTAVLRYVELHSLRPAHRLGAAEASSFVSGQDLGRAESSTDKIKGTGFSSYIGEPRIDGALGPAGNIQPKIPQTREEAQALCPQPRLDLIASFQHAVVGDLLKKTFAAAESLGAARILVTGGVAANRELRARFTAEAARRSLRVSFPTLALSTDNAAMIAAAAWPRLQSGDFAPSDLTADPSLALGQIQQCDHKNA
ncbi:MAG: tRNA (adenosine(37)-N6)-threonylcarbamoyltransferase complex transferase subunit TsaD [Terracidiphilus sp.]